MYSKGHLKINKYFAFVFMVFAVISGVSDDYSEANATSARNGASPYFLRINHFLTQDASRIKAQILAKRYNAFSAYIDHILAAKDVSNYINLGFALGVLVFCLFLVNIQIKQNNLWRATVF